MEVRNAEFPDGLTGPLYPKPIPSPYEGKRKDWMFNEYRFYCQSCRKEWVYDSLWRQFAEVPEKASFVYDLRRKLLVVNPLGAYGRGSQ